MMEDSTEEQSLMSFLMVTFGEGHVQETTSVFPGLAFFVRMAKAGFLVRL